VVDVCRYEGAYDMSVFAGQGPLTLDRWIIDPQAGKIAPAAAVMAYVHNPERGAADLVILAAQDFTGEPGTSTPRRSQSPDPSSSRLFPHCGVSRRLVVLTYGRFASPQTLALMSESRGATLVSGAVPFPQVAAIGGCCTRT
jgi:hypothetical protein